MFAHILKTNLFKEISENRVKEKLERLPCEQVLQGFELTGAFSHLFRTKKSVGNFKAL